MSQSTDGLLVYGYDLGSGDDEWKVREPGGEYGELVTPWYDERFEEGDFPTLVENALLHAAGFAEEDDGTSGYYDRRSEARDRLGVEIETYCSDVSPMYVLCAATLRVTRGHIVDTAPVLARDRSYWDERLAWALKALGLAPSQEKPAWLLCSYADGF